MSTKKATKKAAKTAADTRPTLTRLEVEKRVAGAGHEAVQKASKAGASDKLVKTLARTASREVYGQLEIKAPSLNSMVALDRYWASDLYKNASMVMALVYTVYAYLNPDRALTNLAESEDVFHTQAVEFSKTIELEQLRAIAASVKGHIGDLFGTGGAAEEATPGEPRPKK